VRIRYKKLENGKYTRSALIYQAAEHKIDRDKVDADAIRVIGRLKRYGYEAYLVGGAVRDLLCDRTPKDFDITTSAEPNQIKRLFRNSRIIGKRFRLVHVFFPNGKILEVSTFRSPDAEGFKNVFGTLDEDACRRDFSINALYYDPYEEVVLDFVGGLKDLRRHRISAIIPRKQIFSEDPVRMLRAVKYSISTDCRIPFFLSRQIKKEADLLGTVSASRLSEEAFKFFSAGHAQEVFERLEHYGLLKSVFPELQALLLQKTKPSFKIAFYKSLHTLDEAVRTQGESRRFVYFAYLLGDYVHGFSEWKTRKKLPFSEVYRDVKDLIKPVTPPNIEIERALFYLGKARESYFATGRMPAFNVAWADEAEARRTPQVRRFNPAEALSNGIKQGMEFVADGIKGRKKRRSRRKKQEFEDSANKQSKIQD